jgi:hypothetical protein
VATEALGLRASISTCTSTRSSSGGAFVSPSSALAPRFQPAAPLADADVAELVEQLARRITRYLERQGRLPQPHAPIDSDDSAELDASLFDQLCAASIQGGAALAPESSRPIARLGQRRSPRPPPLPGSLCADHNRFSLHAKVYVPAGEKRAARAPLPLRDAAADRDAASRTRTQRPSHLRPQAALARRHVGRLIRPAHLHRAARGIGSTTTRSSAHLPRRARASLRLA